MKLPTGVVNADSFGAMYAAMPCTECGQMFANNALIEEHLKLVHAYYGFCYICLKGFRSKTGFKFHMKMHGDGIKCDVCGKGFQSGYHLRRHQLVHNKDKSQCCVYCRKSFKFKHDMLQYLQICKLQYVDSIGNC